MRPFSLDDDGGASSGEDNITASVGAMKVSDPERPEGVPSVQNLYNKEDDTLHGCAIYAAHNEEEGTVVLAIDFHGERNVTSIGVMSNLAIAKKVAVLLVAEHHKVTGEHPLCDFLSGAENHHNNNYQAFSEGPRGDEDS